MDSIKKIKDILFDQAKYFLLEAGEFYPFGTVLNQYHEIVPLGVYLDDEHPSPQTVIGVLEREVLEKIISGDSIIGGIATNRVEDVSSSVANFSI
jgi:hypothetical protein